MGFDDDYNHRYDKYIDDPQRANDLIQNALGYTSGVCEGLGVAVAERVNNGRSVNIDFLTRLDYLVIAASNLVDAFNDLTGEAANNGGC